VRTFEVPSPPQHYLLRQLLDYQWTSIGASVSPSILRKSDFLFGGRLSQQYHKSNLNEILAGIGRFHSLNIVHNGTAPNNIVLDEDEALIGGFDGCGEVGKSLRDTRGTQGCTTPSSSSRRRRTALPHLRYLLTQDKRAAKDHQKFVMICPRSLQQGLCSISLNSTSTSIIWQSEGLAATVAQLTRSLSLSLISCSLLSVINVIDRHDQSAFYHYVSHLLS
jgi:serine/threonine protein kinase